MGRIERIEQRTRYQKVFDTDVPESKVAVIGAAPVHYRTPQGEWDDMANLVKEVAGGWVAETDETRVGIENGYLTFTYAGRSLQMRPTMLGMVDATAPATRWRKLADADYTNITRDGDTVTAHDIFPNTDATLTIGEGVITKAFTVRTKPSPPDPVSLGWNPATTYVVIVWDVQKPAGAVVRDTVTLEVVGAGYARKNPLVVETAQGDPVLYFDAGEAVSASGRKGPVWYVCLGSQVPFGEAVPYSRVVNAPYPMVIDPTSRIGITGSNYGTIYDDLGVRYESTDSPTAGNNYASGSDPKNGPWETGGPVRGFIRWDLSALSGKTCTSARLRGYVNHQLVDDRYYLDRVADWSPLTAADWDAGVEILNWSGIKTAAYAAGSTYSVAYSAVTGTWVRTDTSGRVFRSTDGALTWTYITQVTSNLTGFWCVNGVFFLTYHSAYLTTSTDDGLTWSARASSVASQTRPVWTGSRYVLGVVGATNALLTSSDAITWSTVTKLTVGLSATSDWTHVAWDGTYLWAVADTQSAIRRTTDATGATGWVAAAVPDATSRPDTPGVDEFVSFTRAERITTHAGTVLMSGREYRKLWDEEFGWSSPIANDQLWKWDGSGWDLLGSAANLGSGYNALWWSDGTYLYRGSNSDILRSDGTYPPGYYSQIYNGFVYGSGTAGYIGSSGTGVLVAPVNNTYYQAYLRSTDWGQTWTYHSSGDAFTLPAAGVESKFGGILAVRFRAANEGLAVTANITYYASWLEIEYTTGQPAQPALKAVLTKVV